MVGNGEYCMTHNVAPQILPNRPPTKQVYPAVEWNMERVQRVHKKENFAVVNVRPVST